MQGSERREMQVTNDGATILKAIGVDNFSQFGGPRNNFLKHYENFKRLGSQFYDKDYINYFNVK